MRKNVIFCFLVVISLVLTQKYLGLKDKCKDLRFKTKDLVKTESDFKILSNNGEKLKGEFNAQCLPQEKTIHLIESLVDKDLWDEFTHDWCSASKEIKARFCATPYSFYQGHLSFFSFPEEISKCLQQLLTYPVWPFILSIERKYPFNSILQVTIEYFFACNSE